MDTYTATIVSAYFDNAMQDTDRATVTEWLDDHTGDMPTFVWYAVRALEEYADNK